MSYREENEIMELMIKEGLASPEVDPIASITVISGDFPAAIDEAERALVPHAERFGVFQRAGELVQLIRLSEERRGGGLTRPAGIAQIIPLNPLVLREIFERVAIFTRSKGEDENGKPKLKAIDCPARIPLTYCARGSWRVPVLTSIISAPVMRDDGTILSKPGYDQETGLYLASDDEWPAIPDWPLLETAKIALQELIAPFKEFPFRSEADKSTHVTAIPTAIQRAMLDACPLFAYSAPIYRSGKTLLAGSVATIATGRPAPATALSTEREEIRKVIFTVLREGHPIVNLDNVEGVLASPDLARAITEATYSDRILGESRKLTLPTKVLWIATGNNLTFRGDLTARVLLCRIDAEVERPEERTFAIPNLIEYLQENRKTLVAAALTVLRAYHCAGRPSQNLPPWGGFDQWSAVIRSAMVWAGMEDPCKTRDQVISDDPEMESSSAALLKLSEVFDREFTLNEAITTANERRKRDDGTLGELPELHAELHAALKAVASSKKSDIDNWRLGAWAREWKDRFVGGLRLRSGGKRHQATLWRIEKKKESDALGEKGECGSVGESPLLRQTMCFEREVNSSRGKSSPLNSHTPLRPPKKEGATSA